MTIQNFEISIFFENFSKFQNFEFSLTFSTKTFSIKKSKIFGPKKISTKKFSDFFRRFFSTKMFLGHLFRSQIFPRFQKSHLENRAVSLMMRKIEKQISFYKIFPILVTFGYMLCITTLEPQPEFWSFFEQLC